MELTWLKKDGGNVIVALRENDDEFEVEEDYREIEPGWWVPYFHIRFDCPTTGGERANFQLSFCHSDLVDLLTQAWPRDNRGSEINSSELAL